jgi:TRAP-type transport system periplasmic protein
VNEPIQIRMGGYGPPSTTFSRGLKSIGDRLEQEFGDRVDIKYVWNIMDLGYRGEDIWWLVEHGLLTLGYQSSSALTERIPELGVADLPFLFASNDEARAAVDGPLGALMASRMEDRANYRILGFFENGFRHISNRLRPLHGPEDLAGLRIRTLNSKVHARTFAKLGAIPNSMGLKEALERMAEGRVDAQENPLANTVTYGAHKLHRFHTLTGHFYIAADLPQPDCVRLLAARTPGRHARRRAGCRHYPARSRCCGGGDLPSGDSSRRLRAQRDGCGRAAGIRRGRAPNLRGVARRTRRRSV